MLVIPDIVRKSQHDQIGPWSYSTLDSCKHHTSCPPRFVNLPGNVMLWLSVRYSHTFEQPLVSLNEPLKESGGFGGHWPFDNTFQQLDIRQRYIPAEQANTMGLGGSRATRAK